MDNSSDNQPSGGDRFDHCVFSGHNVRFKRRKQQRPVKQKTDTNKGRKAAEERTKRTLEKYEFKMALAKSWEKIDKPYYQRLMNQANKLHASLVLKGVL